MIIEQVAPLEHVRHSYASSINNESQGNIININTGGNLASGKAMSPGIIPTAASRVINGHSRPQTNTPSIFTNNDSYG